MPRTVGGSPGPAAASAAAASGTAHSTPQSNPWTQSQLQGMLRRDEDDVPELLRGSASTPSPVKKGRARCSAGSPEQAARLSRMATPSKGRLTPTSDSSRSSSDSSSEGEDQPAAGGSMGGGALVTPAQPGQRASSSISAPHSAAAEPGAARSLSRRALNFGCDPDVPAVHFRSGPTTPLAELAGGRDEPAVDSRRTSRDDLVQLDSKGKPVAQQPRESSALLSEAMEASVRDEAERARRAAHKASKEEAETKAAERASRQSLELERRLEIDSSSVYAAIRSTLRREIYLSSLMVPPSEDAFAETDAPCRVIYDPDGEKIPTFFHPVDLMFTPGILDTPAANIVADPACVALFPHWRFSTDPDMNCYVVSLINVIAPRSLLQRGGDPAKGEGGKADKDEAAKFRSEVATWMREQLEMGSASPVWTELCTVWNAPLNFKDVQSDDLVRVTGIIETIAGAAALTEDFAAAVAVKENMFLVQSRFCDLSMPYGLAPIGERPLDRDFLHGVTAELLTGWPRIRGPPRPSFAPRCHSEAVPGEGALTNFGRGSGVMYSRHADQRIAHVNPLIPAPNLFNSTVNHPLFPFECTRWTPLLPMAHCSFFLVPAFTARTHPLYHRDPANNGALQVQSCESVVLRPFMLVQNADEREAAADSDCAPWSLILFTFVEVSRIVVDRYLTQLQQSNADSAEKVAAVFLDATLPPDDRRMSSPMVVVLELPEEWSLEEASDAQRVASFLNSDGASSRINLCTVTVDCFHCGPVLLSGNQAEVLVDESNTENTDTALCLDIPQPVLDAVILEIFGQGLLPQIERQATAIDILAAAPPGETAEQRGARVDTMLRDSRTVPALWRSFLRQVVDDADNSKWEQKADFLQVLRHAVPTKIKPQFVLLADHAIGPVPNDADFIGEIQPWKEPAAARAAIRAERQAAADAMESEVDMTDMGAAVADVKKEPITGGKKMGRPKKTDEDKKKGQSTHKKKAQKEKKNPPTTTVFVPPDVDPSASAEAEAAKWKASLTSWMNALPRDGDMPAAWTYVRAFNDLVKPVCNDEVMQPLIATLRTAGRLTVSGDKNNLKNTANAVLDYLAVHDQQAYALFFLEEVRKTVIEKLQDPQQKWRADKKLLYRHLPRPSELQFGDEVRTPSPSPSASRDRASSSEPSVGAGRRAIAAVSNRKRKGHRRDRSTSRSPSSKRPKSSSASKRSSSPDSRRIKELEFRMAAQAKTMETKVQQADKAHEQSMRAMEKRMLTMQAQLQKSLADVAKAVTAATKASTAATAAPSTAATAAPSTAAAAPSTAAAAAPSTAAAAPSTAAAAAPSTAAAAPSAAPAVVAPAPDAAATTAAAPATSAAAEVLSVLAAAMKEALRSNAMVPASPANLFGPQALAGLNASSFGYGNLFSQQQQLASDLQRLSGSASAMQQTQLGFLLGSQAFGGFPFGGR